MRGWLLVGIVLLLIVGTGAGGAMLLVQSVLDIVAGEFEKHLRGGTVLFLRADSTPGRFWFWTVVHIAFSLTLIVSCALLSLGIVRRKRASGQTWSAYIAGFAAKAGAGLPTGRPVGSRVGNFLAWILLVPVVLFGLIVVAVLVTMK